MYIVGWLSSIILLITLLVQIYKQWKARSNKGVAKFLFVGQLIASIGFTLYSISTHDTVFIVTNSLLALSAIGGISIYLVNR